MTAIDIQLSPANSDWATLRAATVLAEQRGYRAVFVFDHLAGLPLEGTTMLECFGVLGALVEITTTVELGTMVANVWNRQVGTLVSAAATIATLSGRQFHLGIGAGAAPASRWAAEQHAVGAVLAPSLEERHARVEEVIDLAARQWTPDRDAELATFPFPARRPTVLVGVNSVRLSRLAGGRADGVNVPWRHPRRDEFLAAADETAGDRPFLRTAYTSFRPELLDPAHPDRVAMTDRRIERLVLAVFDTLDGWIADGELPSSA